MIIGFGHRAQSGKDTCGQYLVDRHGYKRVAFADPLKRAAMQIFGLTEQQCYGSKANKETVDPRWGFTPRYAMQTLGEKLRVIFGEDVWVKSAEAQILNTKIDRSMPKGEIAISLDHVTYSGGVVITDVRYPNEAQMIRSLGGIVVRVDRPSLGPLTDAHPSETSMEGFDYDDVILNDGSLEALYAQVDRIISTRSTSSGRGRNYNALSSRVRGRQR
jgi:hypothetical protein